MVSDNNSCHSQLCDIVTDVCVFRLAHLCFSSSPTILRKETSRVDSTERTVTPADAGLVPGLISLFDEWLDLQRSQLQG